MPVIPFKEVVGNAAKTPPEQIGLMLLKAGVVNVLMVTEVVATTPAQSPLPATV